MSERVERQARLAGTFLDDLRRWVETDCRLALYLLDLVKAVLREPKRFWRHAGSADATLQPGTVKDMIAVQKGVVCR